MRETDGGLPKSRDGFGSRVRVLRQLLSSSAVQTAYFILLLAITVYSLIRGWGHLPVLFGRTDWRLVWLAGAILFAATLFYVYVQYTIYQGMGVRLTFRQVFCIVCLASLGKYVPGKVLWASNYYLLSRQAGVDVREIGGSFVISTAIWIVTAMLCSLPSLSLLSPALRYTMLLLSVILLISIHPRILGLVFDLLAWALRKAGRPAAANQIGRAISLPYRFYLKTLVLYLVAWSMVGVQVFFLVAALQKVGPTDFFVSLAAGAIGTVVGFVALFAPGGLGVREGLGAVILAQIMTAESALFVFVLLRLMTVVVDLGFGGLGLLLNRKAIANRQS